MNLYHSREEDSVNAVLRFSRLKTPRICNCCAKVANYELAAGIHNLVLCKDCTLRLGTLIEMGTDGHMDTAEYDHMQEVRH